MEIEPFIPQSGAHYDVIVAGGGPAGLGAAVSAAMNGAKTLLLEGRASFGGIAAQALWMPLNRMYLHGESRGGVHEMLLKQLDECGPNSYLKGRTDWFNGDNAHIQPEYLQLAAYRLLESVGCHYRLHTPVTGAKVENGRVTAVISNNKSGEEVFYADIFVDCTGDGDIAYFSGAEMVKGSELDGLLVAGRCASATQMGQASGKSMGNMMDMGQAAGLAAALCVKHGVEPRNLNVSEIQGILIHKMGVHLFG